MYLGVAESRSQCSHYNKKWQLSDGMEALADAMVVIISQYINVSNQHVYILNLHNIICQSCLNKLVKKIQATGRR